MRTKSKNPRFRLVGVKLTAFEFATLEELRRKRGHRWLSDTLRSLIPGLADQPSTGPREVVTAPVPTPPADRLIRVQVEKPEPKPITMVQVRMEPAQPAMSPAVGRIPDAAPTEHAFKVRDALRRHRNEVKQDLLYIPDFARDRRRALKGIDVPAALLQLCTWGLVELRQWSGVDPMSEEDKALCPIQPAPSPSQRAEVLAYVVIR